MPRSSLSLGFFLLGVAACASETAPSRLTAPQNPLAITYGSADQSNTYSNVGAFVVQRKSDGRISPICTGTLISPTVFLTAGHCTAYFSTLSPSTYAAAVSFDNPLAWGDLSSQATVILATAVITNPEYSQRQSDPADLGVLLLAAQDTRGISAAALPTLGLLDQLFAAGTLQSETFTAVGYGLQNRLVGRGQPYFRDQNPIPRMYALSSFSALNPAYLRLSQNPATGDGGTCYGDSGGPNFVDVEGTLVLAATTVTGDDVCRATNVDYRLDTRTARRFLGQYVTLP
jgi:secreted trypsin-like serine protease